ncbi:hypothetical protein RN001_012255 [Aquatica leii]|uniref:Uncharacterized protein n=1 Tax=Aquatica leii TaxID=1421715 RepID=A0AAN7SMD4_9COLE|nr:hypothetical protein RN001_012255 [Aquatica leii]
MTLVITLPEHTEELEKDIMEHTPQSLVWDDDLLEHTIKDKNIEKRTSEETSTTPTRLIPRQTPDRWWFAEEYGTRAQKVTTVITPEIEKEKDEVQAKTFSQKRKFVIVITPPKQKDRTPKNIGLFDLAWDEKEGTSKKRKKRDQELLTNDEEKTCVALKLGAKCRSIISAIDKEIRELAKLARENKNTKIEIKESSSRLTSLSSILMTTEIGELLQSLGRVGTPVENDEVTIKLLEELHEMKEEGQKLQQQIQKGKETERILSIKLQEVKDTHEDLQDQIIAVKNTAMALEKRLNTMKQTEETGDNIKESNEMCLKCKERMTKEERITKNIKKEIRKLTNQVDHEEMEKLMDRDWPEAVYQKTELTTSDALMETESDVLVITTGNKADGLYQATRRRYPELIEEIEDGDDCETYIDSAVVSKKNRRSRRIYLLRGTASEISQYDFKKMIREVVDRGKDTLSVAVEKSFDELRIRKKIKIIMQEYKIKIKFTGKSLTKREIKERKTDAVKIMKEGTSYVNVLKRVKEKLKGSVLENQVIEVRSTQKKRAAYSSRKRKRE